MPLMPDDPEAQSGLHVDLREYIEALFHERERAVSMAHAEREKAATVLRDEQHRALDQAEKEREKAASALRDALAQSIKEGDERLREHIVNQVNQINATLKSGDLLEIERIHAVRAELIALVDGNTREFRQVQAATKQAVDKAEEAQLRVNVGQNEFRGQLSDQANTLMPRREVEAVLTEHVRQLAELREQLGKLRTELAVGPAGLSELSRQASHHEGERDHKAAASSQSMGLIAAFAGIGLVLVTVAGIVIALITQGGGG